MSVQHALGAGASICSLALSAWNLLRLRQSNAQLASIETRILALKERDRRPFGRVGEQGPGLSVGLQALDVSFLSSELITSVRESAERRAKTTPRDGGRFEG